MKSKSRLAMKSKSTYITIKNLDGSIYLSGWLGFQQSGPRWLVGIRLQRDGELVMRSDGSDWNDAFFRMMEAIDLGQFTIEISAGTGHV